MTGNSWSKALGGPKVEEHGLDQLVVKMEGREVGLDRADSRALILVGLALVVHHGGAILVMLVVICLEVSLF
jgi:hypothetical protein